MLQQLLPSFQSKFRTEEHGDLIDLTMREEKSRLMDPAYLESQVIGKGEFDWDFRCLKPGFLDIVSPFMRESHDSSHLMLLALEELGVTGTERRTLIPIAEFPHFIARVNDYYNLHTSLNQPKPKRRIAARLTQLKYAAQFLGVYPRHIVLHNHMGVNRHTLNRFHASLFKSAVMNGTSRGLMMEWSRSGLSKVSEASYLQASVHTLAGYFLGPISFACIMAEVPEEETQKVKEAFSWLSVAAKLELERRVISDMVTEPLSQELRSEFLISSFPGAFEIQSPRTENPAYNQFPDFAKWHQEIIAAHRDHEVLSHPMVDQSLDHFQEIMAATGLLPNLTQQLVSSLSNKGECL